MVDIEKIKEYFMILSSVDVAQCQRILPVIENATEYVLSVLKDGAVHEKNIKRIEGLCGAVAYYRYALLEFGKCDDQVRMESMTFSGDISKKINSAKMLQQEHFKACSDIIKNKTAVFKKVNIDV
ncbi:MAG: hypothetical protein RR048_02225 [Oscillospiraceae bacterium]